MQFFQKNAPKDREQCSLTFPKGGARAPSAPPGNVHSWSCQYANESQANLYKLSPNYRSAYQSAVEDKSKGSGLALYVRHEFNFKNDNKLSTCGDDLEAGVPKPGVILGYIPPIIQNFANFRSKTTSKR